MALMKVGSVTPSDKTTSTPVDLHTLKRQLAEGQAEQRRQAAQKLSAFPEAVDFLCQHLGKEDSPVVQEVIFTSLTLIGGNRTVEALMPLLRSDDAVLRNGAIEVLKQLPDDISPRIEELLKDPDPDVRIFAVNVLESLKHPDVEQWLISVIAADPHVNVVATALDLLCEVGTALSLPILESVSHRFPDDPFIAFAADNAVKRIRTT